MIRILHVVGGMNRGGIETWLMHILRHIDRDRFQMDFLVHTDIPCPYDDEIRGLGSRVIPCLHPSKPIAYARNFQQILKQFGPYDIIHSHVHNFSGYVLRLAKQANIPVRIAHSHNDTSFTEIKASLSRRLYLGLTKWWIARYKTIGLAASRVAAISLFDANWERDLTCQILYYGVALAPFRDRVGGTHLASNCLKLRAELGIPADAFAIGHIGRFEAQKNHGFLLEIAAAIAKKTTNIHLLLVGDGLLRPEIERKAIAMGIDKYIIFAGVRSDVPQLMLGVMDVFILPSFYEGLPLVLIEAQAAGLSCAISDVVSEESDIVKSLVRRISLSESPDTWAKNILALRDDRSSLSQTEALAILEKSPFNIENSLKNLVEVYEHKCSTARH